MAARKPIVLVNGNMQQLPAGDTLIPSDLGIDATAAMLAAGTDNSARPTVAQVSKVASPGALGTLYRTFTDRFSDGSVCAFEFMSASVVAAIKAGNNTTDVTSALQAALDTGRNVYLPAGRYPISAQLAFKRNGQKILGESLFQGDDNSGLFGTVFVVSAAKGTNFGFTSYLLFLTRCELSEVAFEFSQSAAASSGARADLVAYPWAVDVSTAPGFKIGRLGLFRAYNGVRALGNCGAGIIEHVIDGSLNVGLDMDGPLHALSIKFWDSWPYGSVANNNLLAIFSDGNTIACRFGRCDELMIDTIAAFRTRVVMNFQVRGIPALISKLGVDDTNGRVEMNSGRAIIGSFYGTTNSASDAKVVVVGGLLEIGCMTADANASAHTGLVVVTSGRCVILGGDTITDRVSTTARVSGGTLEMHGVKFAGNDSTNSITQPKVKQSGAGRLVMVGCQPDDKASGATGTFVEIGQDGQHVITGNNFLGWALSLPAVATLGTYGPNTGLPIPANTQTGLIPNKQATLAFLFQLNSSGNGQIAHGLGANFPRTAFGQARIRATSDTGDALAVNLTYDDTFVKVLMNNANYSGWNAYVRVWLDA